MEEAPAENVMVVDHHSREWARLIRKLRWIGLEEQAHRLELAVSTLAAYWLGRPAPTRRNHLRLQDIECRAAARIGGCRAGRRTLIADFLATLERVLNGIVCRET
jgi:hypothetical protein